MSICEIYNDNVYDLINTPAKGDLSPLEVRQAKDGSVYVENLTKVEVHSYKQVLKILRQANSNRATVLIINKVK